MARRLIRVFTGAALALLSIDAVCASASTQSPETETAPSFSAVETLGLSAAQSQQLRQVLEARDYISAEKILLPQIHQNDRTPHTALLLNFLGGVYYLDHDYLHAAVAWKKSESIAPLKQPVEFTLAMAYLRLGHPDWARQVLTSLAAQNPSSAVYPYWLGRIDYDARAYVQAIAKLKHAIVLDPEMARAWDNLGLCYYQQNANALSVDSFQKAIDLDRAAGHPSPWPYYNLAVTLQILGRFPEAETSLREALRLAPKFPGAHFQLANVLERMNHDQDALKELQQAVALNPDYAEAHFALGRLYRRLGREADAQAEIRTYLQLRASASAIGKSPEQPQP